MVKKRKSSATQMSFMDAPLRQFGGSLQNSHPKTARTLSSKEALHLVMKSKQAFGMKSMLHPQHCRKIHQLIHEKAQKFGVRIYRYVNVGNHLHLVIRVYRRKGYIRFIKSVSGLIARLILQRERGPRQSTNQAASQIAQQSTKNAPTTKKKLFWVSRPFTRLISWGRDYNHVIRYMKKNEHQAIPAWGFDIVDPQQIRALSSA